MAGKSSDNQALVDAIKQAIKEGLKDSSQTNRDVEKEIKSLNKNLEKYIERIKASGDIKASFEELSKEISSTIAKTAEENAKKILEDRDQYNKNLLEKEKDLNKKIEALREEREKGGDVFTEEREKELKGYIEKSEKSLKAFKDNFAERQKKQEEAFEKQLEDTKKQLLTDVATGFKSLGESTFKKNIRDNKDVDKALGNYKEALKQQYSLLLKNNKLKKDLNVSEDDLQEIKEELYDSYFKEIEKQKESDRLDDNLKKLLNDRLKREKILAGRATYEQTYGGGSSISKLAGKLADFTTKRFKQQNENTSEGGKIFNAGLAALFKGKDANKPFLEEPEAGDIYKPNNPQKRVGGGPGNNNAVEPSTSVEVEKINSDEIAAEEANESVNPDEQLEVLQAMYQVLENATENVPLKVDISDISTAAKKDFKEAFISAIQELMGSMPKSNAPKALGWSGEMPKQAKKEEESGPIIDVDDLNKLGFFKRAGRFLGKAGRGIGSAARGASGLARGSLANVAGRIPLVGGALNTSLGSMGGGALLGTAALAAGTFYAGKKAGNYLEDEFSLGTKGLEAVGVNKETNKLEETQEELNKNLQEVSKIKDPREKRIAYFETQLETLEKQKTIQSGDEKAQTEHMITVVKGKLEKLKNQPEAKPAPATTTATTPEISAAVNTGAAAISAATAVPVVGAPSVPTVPTNIPQSKDVTPELNTNNKLTEQTNQILGELVKVMAGKDYNPSTIAPIMVAQAAPSTSSGQTQSPAYQFRSQNRTEV